MKKYLDGIKYIINEEEVTLRGLTFGEFSSLMDVEYNSQYLPVFDVGVLVIKHFQFSDQSGNWITYDVDKHFEFLFEQNFDFVRKCVTIAIDELSSLSEEQKRQIEQYLYFVNYLSDNKETESSWNCDKCINSQLIKRRNCSRYTQEEVRKILTGEWIPDEFKGRLNFEDEASKKLDEIDQAREQFKKRQNRNSLKSKLNRAKKKHTRHLVKKEEEVAPKFVLKDKFYEWKKCPVWDIDRGLLRDGMFTYRCISNNSMVVQGTLLDQPMKFVELKSEIESVQAEIKNKESKELGKETKRATDRRNQGNRTKRD